MGGLEGLMLKVFQPFHCFKLGWVAQTQSMSLEVVFNDYTTFAKVIEAIPSEIKHGILEFDGQRIVTCSMCPSQIVISGVEIHGRLIDHYGFKPPEDKKVFALCVNLDSIKDIFGIVKKEKSAVLASREELKKDETEADAADAADDGGVSDEESGQSGGKLKRRKVETKQVKKKSATAAKKKPSMGRTQLTICYNCKPESERRPDEASSDKLQFVFRSGNNIKKATVDLIDATQATPMDLPNLPHYECKVRMESASFASLCHSIKEGHVSFKFERNVMNIEFECKGTLWENRRVAIEGDESLKIVWNKNKHDDEEKKIVKLFTAKKLSHFVPATGTSHYVELRFYNEDPMVVRYYLKDEPKFGYICYLLAPRELDTGLLDAASAISLALPEPAEEGEGEGGCAPLNPPPPATSSAAQAPAAAASTASSVADQAKLAEEEGCAPL